MNSQYDFPKADWNLIITPPMNGSMNMAIDEALLKSIGANESLPILRLYAWEPACISLGYAQKYNDIDEQHLKAKGWEVVRRTTGGRAILHTDEITYAVIGAKNEPRLVGDVLASYKRISKALLASLKILNAPAIVVEQTKINQTQRAEPICFEIPSSYEITLNGKKIIGSAQARKKEGVLQHGSLPLTGDLTRITEILRYKNDNSREFAKMRMMKNATTLQMELGINFSWDEAAKALEKSFVEELNINFIPRDLSEREFECAAELQIAKYGNPSWTEK
jgi:lipoyl(octanoyl) transferase